MSGTGKNGKPYFAYTVKGSQSEIAEYIECVTTCKEYPKDVDQITSEDGSITFFSNKLVPSDHNEIFLSATYGAYTKNSIRKQLANISREIDLAEANGSSTRILEKKENILIEQDMEQESRAQAEMDQAMSNYRNNNSQEQESEDTVEPKAKAKSKAKAKAVVEDDEDDLV